MLVCNILGTDTFTWRTDLKKDRAYFGDWSREDVHQSCQTRVIEYSTRRVRNKRQVSGRTDQVKHVQRTSIVVGPPVAATGRMENQALSGFVRQKSRFGGNGRC